MNFPVIGTEATLAQMLSAFDPKKHGGEVMVGGTVGVEAFVDGNSWESRPPPQQGRLAPFDPYGQPPEHVGETPRLEI